MNHLHPRRRCKCIENRGKQVVKLLKSGMIIPVSMTRAWSSADSNKVTNDDSFGDWRAA